MDIDINATLREQEARQAAELLEQVLGTGPQLDSVEITREYELGADVVLRSGSPADDYRITGVITRIRATKLVPLTPEADHSCEPYFSARGYRTPYTAAGKPSRSEKPAWTWLPDLIARELLKDETTAADTSSSASRQHYIDTGRYLLVDEASAWTDATS